MIITIATSILLTAGVLLFPVWLQIVLFTIAVFSTPNKVALLIPAIISDALYSPQASFSFGELRMTMLVGILLVIQWFLFTKTRLPEALYGMEKK